MTSHTPRYALRALCVLQSPQPQALDGLSGARPIQMIRQYFLGLDGLRRQYKPQMS